MPKYLSTIELEEINLRKPASGVSRDGFFQVQNVVLNLYGRDLGPYGIALYVALSMHAGAPDKTGRRKCWPSYPTLQQETGMSRNSVIRHLPKLAELGLIEIVPGNASTSNTYYLLPIKPCQIVAPPAPTPVPTSTFSTPIPDDTDTQSQRDNTPVLTQPPTPEPSRVPGVVPHRDGSSATERPEQDSLNNTHINKTQERGDSSLAALKASVGDTSIPAPARDALSSKQKRGELLELVSNSNLNQQGSKTHINNNQSDFQQTQPVISFEARQVQDFARQKFGGKMGQGMTCQWLDNRLQQYGQKAVRAAITIAEERARPAASFISSVLERMTPDELSRFSPEGHRLGVFVTTTTAATSQAARPSSTTSPDQHTYSNANGRPPDYPFAVFTAGFHDDPARIEQRIENLRVRDALTPDQERELAVRLEWARRIVARKSSQTQPGQIQSVEQAQRSVTL